MLEKLFTVVLVYSMLKLTIHVYKLSLLGKLTFKKKIIQETAGLSQSARKWTQELELVCLGHFVFMVNSHFMQIPLGFT